MPPSTQPSKLVDSWRSSRFTTKRIGRTNRLLHLDAPLPVGAKNADPLSEPSSKARSWGTRHSRKVKPRPCPIGGIDHELFHPSLGHRRTANCRVAVKPDYVHRGRESSCRKPERRIESNLEDGVASFSQPICARLFPSAHSLIGTEAGADPVQNCNRTSRLAPSPSTPAEPGARTKLSNPKGGIRETLHLCSGPAEKPLHLCRHR